MLLQVDLEALRLGLAEKRILLVLEEGGPGAALQGIMACTEERLVSMDYKGDPHSSIVDLQFTQVLEGDLAKLVAWYDNEWGYSCRVSDLAAYMVKRGI